jgi:hypothetical protein
MHFLGNRKFLESDSEHQFCLGGKGAVWVMKPGAAARGEMKPSTSL